MSRCPHSGGRRAHPVLWRAVNPNFGASFATRAVVPAQRITALRALGGTSRDRAFPITDPRIPVANANRKAPALVIEPRVARFGPGRLASNRAVRCQSPPAENLPSYVRVKPGRPDELVKGAPIQGPFDQAFRMVHTARPIDRHRLPPGAGRFGADRPHPIRDRRPCVPVLRS